MGKCVIATCTWNMSQLHFFSVCRSCDFVLATSPIYMSLLYVPKCVYNTILLLRNLRSRHKRGRGRGRGARTREKNGF